MISVIKVNIISFLCQMKSLAAMREGNGAAQEAPLHATVYHSSVIYFQEAGVHIGALPNLPNTAPEVKPRCAGTLSNNGAYYRMVVGRVMQFDQKPGHGSAGRGNLMP